jgi:hypothetical protein
MSNANTVRDGEVAVADMDSYTIRIHAGRCRAADVLASRKRRFVTLYTKVAAEDVAECVSEQGFTVVRCACTKEG